MSRRFHKSMRIPLLIALCSLGAFAEDHYVVKIRGDVNAVAKRYGLTVAHAVVSGPGGGYYVLSSKGQDPKTVLQNLSTEFSVQSAETDKAIVLPGVKPASAVTPATVGPNFSIPSTYVKYHNSFVPSGYVDQPASGIINLTKAQTLATGNGAVVATIDTGVDFTHPGLAPSLIAGWDFVHNTPGGMEQADLNQETTPILDQETTPILDQETTPILDGGGAIILNQETTPILDQETTPILDGKTYPAYGHGTMVAGLIHLVAPDAKIMPLRAFAANGASTVSQIVAALYFAADRKVNSVNMSFSLTIDSPALRDAIDYANGAGVILVAAAGNNGQALRVWPAAYDDVMGIAATDNSDIRATWSNYGNQLVTVAAPGVGVITMYPQNHYAKVSGTSFSAPLVTGGTALLADLNKKIQEDAADAAIRHARPIGQELGAGELDLFQACSSVSSKKGGDN